MSGPIRVTLSRKKGWRMPPNTVKVCRPGKFGNPFRAGHGIIATAGEAVTAFKAAAVAGGIPDIKELRGKNLACWCKAGEPCHADVLLELANRGDL